MGLIKIISLASLISVLAGCGGSDGGSQGSGGNALNFTSLQALNAAEAKTATYVREEEKLARDVYLTLAQANSNAPFQTIATQSEQKHMDTLQKLLTAAGLPDPVLSNSVGAFTDTDLALLYQNLLNRGSTSMVEALQVGAYIEEFDIQDLQEAIQETQQGTHQTVVIQTYERLMCGSRNHLRSFVKALKEQGVSYQAQVIPSATVNTILEQSQEQCGKV
jgi:hypothetical protein